MNTTRNGGEVLPNLASVGGVFPQVGVAAGGHLHHVALRHGALRYVSGERRLGGGGQQTELRTCLRVGRGLATRRHSGLHVVGAALGSTVVRSEGSSAFLGVAIGEPVGFFLQGVGEVRLAHPRDEALFVLSHALHRDGSSPAFPVAEVTIIGAIGRARAIVEALGDSHRRGRTTLPRRCPCDSSDVAFFGRIEIERSTCCYFSRLCFLFAARIETRIFFYQNLTALRAIVDFPNTGI